MSMADSLAPLLRNVTLFDALTDDVLEMLAADLEPVELQAGDTLFNKGDVGRSMFIVLDGRVCIHDGDLVFVYKEAGSFFGEMAALHTELRSASVTADRLTHLLRLDQERMHRLLETQSSMSFAIMDALCVRLRDTSRNMSEDFEYMRQVQQIIDAAQSLEAGNYDASLLGEVTEREDALGQLARVFGRMAGEVKAREERLQLEVQTLQIQVDRAKQEQQVAEITDTDYFRNLQAKAGILRRRSELTGGETDA